jgi:hypothetical protein
MAFGFSHVTRSLMNRFDKLALVAAAAVTLLSASEMFAIADLYIEVQHLSAAMTMIGVTGWLIATYGPISVAAGFWRSAKRHRAPWVLHILLLPCAFITLLIGESLLLYAIQHPDFGAMIGAPVAPALVLFVVSVGGYFAALVWTQVKREAVPSRSADHQ